MDDFIETPQKPLKTARRGQKLSRNSITKEARQAKRYQKTRGEHGKDIIIAVLVTAVMAFMAGMYFANKQNAEVQNAVKAAEATAQEVKK